jgi:hypothetical protein
MWRRLGRKNGRQRDGNRFDFDVQFSLEIMVNLQNLLNIAAIALGFVAAICFCIGAATNKIKDIALSCATVPGGNLNHSNSLCAQRAQYIVGATFLIFSFGFQAAAILIPKECQLLMPIFFQSSFVQLLTILLAASAIAFLGISSITTRTQAEAQKELISL